MRYVHPITGGVVLLATAMSLCAATPAVREQEKSKQQSPNPQPTEVQSTEAPATPSPTETPVKVLQLQTAAEPVPEMKYRLLPTPAQTVEGNAAVLYLKAAALSPDVVKDSELASDWLDLPQEEFPADDARKLLEKYQHPLQLLSAASRRRSADWELPTAEVRFFDIQLPEVQPIRRLIWILRLQARLHMNQGRMDEALDSIRTGMMIGQHFSQGPTLVHGLVGVAISGVMLTEVEQFIQRPEAPNLYWALAALPTPLIDLTAAFEVEGEAVLLLPQLQDVDRTDLSPEAWRKKLDELLQAINELTAHTSDSDHQYGFPRRPLSKKLVDSAYPDAKKDLIASGRDRQEVEQMTKEQVILLGAVLNYRQQRDELFKWQHVPFTDAMARMAQAERDLNQADRRQMIPLASMLLPAFASARHAAVRLDRQVAMIQTIEAIRIYAAANRGNLPPVLADIRVVPVPRNPFTGEPFEYGLSDDGAILRAAPPPGWGPSLGLHYKITMTDRP